MSARSKGYWSIVMHKAPGNMMAETVFIYRYNFLDTLAMMLWGMAFFKLGILNRTADAAAKSKRFYLLMALIGYGIGISINYYEGLLQVSNNFSILSINQSFLHH